MSLGNVGVFACRLAERPMYLKRSQQQLNNLYWVTYKSFICCDQVQLEFEPWTDEARNGEIYFQIKVSHNRKDFVGWLLSFNSNHGFFSIIFILTCLPKSMTSLMAVPQMCELSFKESTHAKTLTPTLNHILLPDVFTADRGRVW